MANGDTVLLNAHEAAALLNVTSRTIQRWVLRGVITPHRRVRGSYLFTAAEVGRLARASQQAAS